MAPLTVSLVLYRPDPALLRETLAALEVASCRADLQPDLFLIDNGGSAGALAGLALPAGWVVHHIAGHGNVGFGRGHNLSLDGAGDFHLILNPDLELAPDALVEAMAFMATHPECGLLAPAAYWDDGRMQYLCKRVPAVFDLFLRGFAPAWLKRRFDARLAHYEYRDLPSDRVSDVTLVSGAFMLARTSALQAVGGFDERYFLHFEDLDLSLRMHAQGRVVSDPGVTLIHHGGHAARKGLAHLRLFLRSGLRFFNTHGWRWL